MATEDKSSSKTPEFEPPQACVSRIIKNVLPDNVQITKDARAAFTRAAGIFIFYLTHCANDFSKENKRQTIYTQDVLQALKELDFGEFEPVLEEFLALYRQEASGKKPKEKKSGSSATDADQGDDGDAEDGGAGDGEGDEENDAKEDADEEAGVEEEDADEEGD